MSTLEPVRLGIDYMEHQAVGVQWMIDREASTDLCRGGILADDMGLGKTFQTIGLLKNGLTLRTLIVCPPVLISGWTSELRACGYTVANTGGGKIPLGSPKNTVWLTTYPKVGLYAKAIAACSFQRIVLDEGHCIRNESTARWSHCMAISAAAQTRWILSATPVQNGSGDWKALCKWLRIPPDTDVSRIADAIMLRRTMAELRSVVDALPPPPCFVQHELSIPEGEEGALFHRLCNQMDYVAHDNTVSAFIKLELWMRIQQFIVHPQVYIEGIRAKFGGTGLPDWSAGTTKWTACMSQIARAVNEKVATIVFCQFRLEMDMVAAAAQKAGADVFVVRGGMGVEKVGEAVARAKAAAAAGKAVIVVVQIVAGGAGLNLQFCRRVLFLSQHWNPAVVHQAVGRAVRIGQSAVVEIHLFHVCNDVLDNIDLNICEAHAVKVGAAREVCSTLYEGFYFPTSL